MSLAPVIPAQSSVPETDFERIFPRCVSAGKTAGFALFTQGDGLFGVASVRAGDDLQEAAYGLYQDLFQAAEGRTLYRIWNQVPGINVTPDCSELENYRAFSAGRSLAFEQRFGAGFRTGLPSASAVGTTGRKLTVAFAAGSEPARHFENPEQVPAYHYPVEHGPRSPSFARATATEIAGRHTVFVSGTAAIKGHDTVAPASLERQLACTLNNLRLISRTAGAGEDLGAGANLRRFFKVYVRASEDLTAVREALEGPLLREDDDVVWRIADLCRSALKVEVEATLIEP